MRLSTCTRGLASVAFLSSGFLATWSSAQDRAHAASYDTVEANKPSSCIGLEFGYFFCRRYDFRLLYGDYLDYGVNFEHRIDNRWSWGLRTEFIYLHRKDFMPEYWILSETPMLIYNISDRSRLVPVIGAGIGLTFRTISATIEPEGEVGGVRSDLTATQRELSAILVGMAGLDFHLSRSIVIGGRFHFDYHPFGDPTVGDFGDTGGYHFTFRLGRKF